MLATFKRYIINIITRTVGLGESLEFDGNDHSLQCSRVSLRVYAFESL